MLLTLVIFVLAVARVTRLINGDKILDRLRLYPANKLREATLLIHESRQHDYPIAEAKYQRSAERWDKAMYFVSCPWCVGLWISIGFAWVPLFFAHNPVAQYVGVALAASHLVGVFAFAADTEEIQIEDADTD